MTEGWGILILLCRILSAICFEIEVPDNIIGGDRGEPLCREGDGVVGGGVRDAVEERHELIEQLFVQVIVHGSDIFMR